MGMVWKHIAFAFAISAWAVLPNAARAQADARAKDAFDFFKTFCVDTDGARDRAIAVIGDGNAMANKLPDSLVAQLQGQPGGIAWAVRSPSDAQLLLGYTASGICEIRIAEAEEPAVVARFADLIASFGSAVHGQSTPPQLRSEDGAARTFRTYEFDRSGKHALIALTTSDKKVGAQQHLITFGFVK
ncbi:MAG: hypothetical protein ABI395_06590 [Sphingobium sp.]